LAAEVTTNQIRVGDEEGAEVRRLEDENASEVKSSAVSNDQNLQKQQKQQPGHNAGGLLFPEVGCLFCFLCCLAETKYT
jgi:hypothetical protein